MRTVDRWLESWSGLRRYIRQRRAGAPSDRIMERMFTEVLRLRLGKQGNPGAVLERLLPR